MTQPITRVRPAGSTPLPSDGHVHTEWSWDAELGSMEASCARAIELGLPSIAFTEHADFATWMVEPESLPRLPNSFRAHLTPEGVFQGLRSDPRLGSLGAGQ
jgi:histidinol-phosphatase (PHP family)